MKTNGEFVMVMDWAINFALNLREIRVAAGVSQRQLAKAIQKDNTFLSHLERGTRLPSVNTLLELAEVLDVEPGCFFENPNTRRVEA